MIIHQSKLFNNFTSYIWLLSSEVYCSEDVDELLINLFKQVRSIHSTIEFLT